MSKTLDFNNLKKRSLTVKFADDKQTTIFVCFPTKALLSELTHLNLNIDKSNDDMSAFDELYDICAKAMSRNRGGVKITKEFLEENFDFEDVLIFIKEYMNFVGEVAGQKN